MPVFWSSDVCSRSEEHTSELQSHDNLVCRLLLEKKQIRRLAGQSTYTPLVCPLSPDALPSGHVGRLGAVRDTPSWVAPGFVFLKFSFFLKNPPPPEFPPFPPPAPFPP